MLYTPAGSRFPTSSIVIPPSWRRLRLSKGAQNHHRGILQSLGLAGCSTTLLACDILRVSGILQFVIANTICLRSSESSLSVLFLVTITIKTRSPLLDFVWMFKVGFILAIVVGLGWRGHQLFI